jgi:50S ribosomal subunit-associated GTPase HflX
MPPTKAFWNVDAFRASKRGRGPGETEIETDRRIVRDRISLKDKIKAIDKQMGTQRVNRGAMVRVLWWVY